MIAEFSDAPGPRRGILFVLSAPSGAGKSTLREGLQRDGGFVYSISCTTRAPRPGEVDGKDYRFLSRADFEARLAKDEFLEHAEVYGNYYGTLRSTVLESLRAGVDVLLDIDVQGAAKVRACADREIADALVDVFLMPESIDVLRARLLKRGTETPAQTEVRLAAAAREMAHWRSYRYTIVGGTIDEDLTNFRAVMRAERAATRRRFPLP